MTEFIGTKKEFHRYIGPFFRNIVQQITKNYRSEIGLCQDCGSTENFEAAHVHGKERVVIIDKLLDEYVDGKTFKIDLVKFETKFRKEHEIFEDAIIILCKECHSRYDSKDKTNISHVMKSEGKQRKIDMDRLFNNTEIQKRISKVLNEFDQLDLDKFCDKTFSKDVFDLNFSLLVKIKKDLPLEKKKEIIKSEGISRWTLKYPIEKNNFLYAISTQWYARNDEYVKKWLKKNETTATQK